MPREVIPAASADQTGSAGPREDPDFEVHRASKPVPPAADDAPADAATIHVHPGEDIQAALDRAAESAEIDRVVVHAGMYRPPAPRQALVWFNARHDGITLEADGKVVLTAANPDLGDKSAPHFPAVVNHVVYFGDGIGPETVLRGFRITGAKNFVTGKPDPEIEPNSSDPRLRKTLFFYTDGGGIKIFGRSYPTLENLEIYDNYSSPCGAGISIEHRGFTDRRVTIRDCVFRNNRVPLTGSAVDLIDHEVGSSAVIENCLFVNNLANEPMDDRSRRLGTWRPQDGHGALTVFPHSRVVVRRCTFVANRNGVDDLADNSVYEDCIFWKNDAPGGWAVAERYELDIKNVAGVTGCVVGGPVGGSSRAIDAQENTLQASDPMFDDAFVPQNPIYRNAGYRPVSTDPKHAADRTTRASQRDVPIASSARAEPLQVLLRGRDFRWHVQYPGADGHLMTADDVRTQSRLLLPADAEVEIRTESDDYLYTVFLPQFDVRQIAVPELTHYLHLKTTDPGTSPLLGDQLCGYTHPDLIGEVVIQPASEFDRWYARLTPAGH